MSYLVLARKWRPQHFEEVVGQRHVSLTLANAIKTDRLSHAYLFSGPRGVGKTSMARILAKALNCEKGPSAEPCNECEFCQSITAGHALDVLEIDGASNRGIDDVRKLRESVKYAPSSLRSKVFIIDEVHMLTTDAFNALLKTLEEPPKHVHFIMATTEPMKVPATILSRCQRFDFGRVSTDDLKAHLDRIATTEKVTIEDDALSLIARKADGSVRDSLTLLDQVFATGTGPFVVGEIEVLLGLSGSGLHFQISEAIIKGDPASVLTLIQTAYSQGHNLQEIVEELVHHFRNIMLCSLGQELENLIETSADERALLIQQSTGARPADALRWLRILLDVCVLMRQSAHARVHLEVALVEMASLPRAVDLGRVVDKLQQTVITQGGCTAPVNQPPGGSVQSKASNSTSIQTPPQIPISKSTSPPPVSTGPPPGDETGQITQAWQEVIEKVRNQKAFLGSCLFESRVVGYRDGRIQIALADAHGFKGDQVKKPANRRLIMLAIEEVLGKPIGLQLLDDTSTIAPALDPVAAEPPRVDPALPENSAPAEPAGADKRIADSQRSVKQKNRNTNPDLHSDLKAGGGSTARQNPSGNPEGDAYSPKDQAHRVAEQLDGDIIGPAL